MRLLKRLYIRTRPDPHGSHDRNFTVVNVKFAKVGEDLTDIEESGVGEYWYDLDYPCVTRSLVIDDDFREEGDDDVKTA